MPIDREKVLQAAQKFVEKKRFDRAIGEYQKIVQEDPNDARTLLKIGDLQARMQTFEDAIATYERVARHYASQGFSVKAIAVYKQIREIIRKHVPQLAEQYGHIIPKLAQLYQDLGLTGDALSAYDEYASHLQRAGRDREAIDIFHKIVEINGNNPLTRLRLAEALLRQKENDEALNQFLVASDILLGMGRSDDALKVIERMLYQKPDPKLARRAAEIYLERGQDEDGMLALAKLQICFQADHRDLNTLLLLARAFEAIGQAPKATEVRKELARLARDQGEFEIAKEAARALLTEAPNDDGVQTLCRSILAAERASAAPGARSEPPPEVLAAPHNAMSDDAVIEVSEEFVDLGDEQSVELEFGEPEEDYEEVPRLEVVAEQLEDFGLSSEDSYEELEPLTDTEVGELPDLEQAPHSIRAVDVSEGFEVAEEFGAANEFDHEGHTREVLANAGAFRTHHLYDKAIETLRIGLEVNPNAFDLHVALKDVLLDAGDRAGACDELIAIAKFYTDVDDAQSGAQLLSEVLSIDPRHAQARDMLIRMGYEVPGQLNDTAEVRAVPSFESRAPMATVEAFSGYEEDYAPSSAGYEHSEPLPSYDLEEINPSYAMSSVPVAEDQADYASLLTTDDPFAAVDGVTASRAGGIDEPFADAGTGDGPLPSFPLSEEGRVPRAISELEAGYDVADAPDQGAPAFDAQCGEPQYAEQQYAEPQYADPQYAEQQYAEQQYAEQQYADPQYADPQYADPQYADPQYADPQYADPQYAEQQYAEPQYAEPQYAEPQYADPQYAEQQYAEQQYAEQQYAEQQYAEQYPGSQSDVATEAALGYAQQGFDESPTHRVESETDEAGPAPLAGTRGFQGGDSLEDALEEAEFFASRGLFEDAMAILQEQGQRFPNHPLLIERMREVTEAMAVASGSGELVVPSRDSSFEELEDNAFDIAASLDVLDGGILEPVEQTDGFGKSVDVEEVFAKFKEGVKAQVSESDSQTHYDLGVAYKEMGLLNDAIAEFTMAARDPKRECVCWSMIGIVRIDQDDTDGAIESFIRGLHSEHKSTDQELALDFELGRVYQARDNPQEALYYFEKVVRRDPNFRDVADRIRSLQTKTQPSRLKTAVGEDEFDRAFDDLFGDSKLSQG